MPGPTKNELTDPSPRPSPLQKGRGRRLPAVVPPTCARGVERTRELMVLVLAMLLECGSPLCTLHAFPAQPSYGDIEVVTRPKACFIPAQGNALGLSQEIEFAG